jgi:hypothetical protein
MQNSILIVSGVFGLASTALGAASLMQYWMDDRANDNTNNTNQKVQLKTVHPPPVVEEGTIQQHLQRRGRVANRDGW